MLTCFHLDSYKVSDLVDGNMFDVSMAAKACFVDGGDCEFNLPILTNALIPKTGRQWDDAYTTKGNGNAHQVINVRNACYVNLRTYYFDSEKLLEIMDKVSTLFCSKTLSAMNDQFESL